MRLAALIAAVIMAVSFVSCSGGVKQKTVETNIEKSLSTSSVSPSGTFNGEAAGTGTEKGTTGSSIPGKPEDKAVPKIAGSVFEYSGNLYFFNHLSGKISVIGDKARKKTFKGLSPDHTKVSFSYDDVGNPPVITVMNMVTGKTNDIVIDNDIAWQVTGSSWVNNSTIMVVSHLNPDAEAYILYDTNTGKEINMCAGILYCVLPDCKTMLVRESPHVFPPMEDNIQIDNKPVYKVNSPEDRLFNPAGSNDMSSLGFLEADHKTASLSFVTADMDLNTKTISNLKRVLVAKSIGVDPLYDGGKGIEGKNLLVSSAVTGDFTEIALLLWNKEENLRYLETIRFDPARKAIVRTDKTTVKLTAQISLSYDSRNNLQVFADGAYFGRDILNSESTGLSPGMGPGIERTPAQEERYRIFCKAVKRDLKITDTAEINELFNSLKE